MLFKVIGRIMANFFRGIGKLIYKITRRATKHPLTAIFVFGLIIVGLILLSFTNFLGLTNGNFLGLASNGNNINKPIQQTTSPNAKTTTFLKALQDAKADDIYTLLSPDYQTLLKKRGIADSTAMQKLLDQQMADLTKQGSDPLHYTFTFAGGLKYDNGAIDDGITGLLETSTSRKRVQFEFRINKDKIENIATDDPIAIAALGIGKTDSKDAAQVGAISSNQSPTAEKFMIGLTTYDVDKVWETLADSYKTDLAKRKVTKDSISKIFDQAKGSKSSIAYKGYVYFRTINFPNGTSSHSYGSVLSISDQPVEPNYTLLLDANNKIIGLSSFSPADNVLELMLGRNPGQ